MTEREFSAGGIVIRLQDQRPEVLLIKDSYGRWTWPKGKIEKGESPRDAAAREIGEETSLRNIELIDEAGKVQYFYRLKGRLVFKTVYLFLFQLKSDEKIKILHEELQDGAWFEVKQAIEKIEYKGAKDFLKKAIKKFLEADR